MSCPEKCRLGLVEGLRRPGSSTPLDFGNITHMMLERGYKDSSQKKPAALRAMADQWQKENQAYTDDAECMLSQIEGLVTAYHEYWEKDDKKKDWVSLEQTFDVPYTLPSGLVIRLRGKIDGVFRVGKKLYLLETKTKGQVVSALDEAVGFNLQVMFYLYAARQLYGEFPAGVLYNILRRPQLRLGKAETQVGFAQRVEKDILSRPDFYFKRMEIAFLKKEQVAWERELADILEVFVNWAEGGPSWHNTGSCLEYGGCEYLHICSGQPGAREAFTVKEHVYPELEEES